MSNASIIERMRGLLEDYQLRVLSPEEFERAIEFHMEALEYIDLHPVHEAQRLCSRLVHAHYADGDEEFGDPHDAGLVIDEFHSFLNVLPTGPA